MSKTLSQFLKQPLVIFAAVALLAACDEGGTVAPEPEPTITQPDIAAQAARIPALEAIKSIATLMAATARYHDLNAAIADGFVLLHPCEERPGEGPVGIVYVNMDRLLDGRIDPRTPDALIYEPAKRSNTRPQLVGVEFAVPYSLWTEPEPPTFLGANFQREDEFGVWALHAWVWRFNPEGLFAEANPRVSCSAD
ncbi:MAG: hypothetical protein ACREMA_05090 [Longimicrobiales bacterium]